MLDLNPNLSGQGYSSSSGDSPCWRDPRKADGQGKKNEKNESKGEKGKKRAGKNESKEKKKKESKGKKKKGGASKTGSFSKTILRGI